MRTQHGSVTVELVLLTPLLMALILFGVYTGRASESLIQVRHAADQAARGASKVSRAQINSTAFAVAQRTLANSGTSCVDISIDTFVIRQGDNNAVRVAIDCTINSQGLSLLGIQNRRVSAVSTEVIDRWRVDS